MACHYRVATKDAKVGQPEVLLGIIPGAGGTQRLPRLAGAPLALEMCTDGKPVAASKAHAAGIVDEIVEGDLLAGSDRVREGAGGGRRAPQDARDRDRRRAGRGRTRGVPAGRAARSPKSARGARAPFAAVDAIEAGADAGLRRRLDPRARALRRLRRLDRVEGAPAPVLRRARSGQGARRPEGDAGDRHPARGGRRRRHHGRRHRDELRERRHPGAPEGGRRRGAAARAGDDPQELRSRRCPRAR